MTNDRGVVRSNSVGTVAALFAGIGGIERGLERSGFETNYLCEWWDPARAVLAHRHPGVHMDSDIDDVQALPPADVVTAGFPCTDLSQAGRMAGIDGKQSGLVRKALRLVDGHSATWLLLENVRNMLVLDGGRAIRSITEDLEQMGFRWAYRLVDSRFAGVPQRRQRVVILASRTEDPRQVLFADDAGERPPDTYRSDAWGFYWTEGLKGLGWAQDAVPTLKGGSTIGLPSSPAIWLPGNEPGFRIVVPGIKTAERLQGFPADWTIRGAGGARKTGTRWKLVGNAVTVGLSEWVGKRLVKPGAWDGTLSTPLDSGAKWPTAAWGERGVVHRVDVSMFPKHASYTHLADMVGCDYSPLSLRATAGFLSRLDRGSLKVYPAEFLVDVKDHVERMREAA